MKIVTKSVSASAIALALSFALSACGGPAEEPLDTSSDAAATETAVAATPTDAAATPAATDTAAAATPTEAASAAATPTPSASASVAAKPTAAATVAAAAPAGPPEAFKQCAVCHKVEAGKNGIGPSLAGVFGAKAGHLGAGFKYSQAMLGSGLTWNQGTLDRFLNDPKGTVPGTLMSFGGVKDDAQRAAIIAYLKTL